jgi:hypothetical protein
VRSFARLSSMVSPEVADRPLSRRWARERPHRTEVPPLGDLAGQRRSLPAHRPELWRDVPAMWWLQRRCHVESCPTHVMDVFQPISRGLVVLDTVGVVSTMALDGAAHAAPLL